MSQLDDFSLAIPTNLLEQIHNAMSVTLMVLVQYFVGIRRAIQILRVPRKMSRIDDQRPSASSAPTVIATNEKAGVLPMSQNRQ